MACRSLLSYIHIQRTCYFPFFAGRTFFKFGLAFFAAGLAFRVAEARIAPARSIGIPCFLAIYFFLPFNIDIPFLSSLAFSALGSAFSAAAYALAFVIFFIAIYITPVSFITEAVCLVIFSAAGIAPASKATPSFWLASFASLIFFIVVPAGWMP